MIIRTINTNNKVLDFSRTYEQKIDFKPKGLWYGVGNSWTDWCKREMPHWIKEYNHTIEIGLTNVWTISSCLDLLHFGLTFKARDEIGMPVINWNKVAKDWAGIEVTNIDEILKLIPPNWFYGWDINSGCIWDLSCVTIK